MTSRNMISDLQAVAASPQLDAMAERLAEVDCAGPRQQSDPMSMLILAACAWTGRSMNQMHSMLQTEDVWDHYIRPAAARVGRDLPAKPPTPDQVYQMLRRNYSAGNEVGHELRDVYTKTAVELGKSVGLLHPRPFDHRVVDRANTVYGDGTIWGYLSDLTEEEFDQSGRRLTAHTRMRIPVISQKGGEELAGPPTVLIGAHGGLRYQRVMLAVAMYPNGNEINAAIEEANRVKRAAGDGMHFLIYDRLADGAHLKEMLQNGYVPLVQMKSAAENTRHLVIPPKDRVQAGGDVKVRARMGLIATVNHPGRSCDHELWGIDGRVVSVKPGLQPHWNSPRCEIQRIHLQKLRRASVIPATPSDDVDASRGDETEYTYDVDVRLAVPCKNTWFDWDLNMSANRQDIPDSSVLNVFRPYPDGDDLFQNVKGWRSDAESVIETAKRMVPDYGRATRHDPLWFQFDMIAAGLLINAIAWDVHGAQFTGNGRAVYEDIMREAERAAHKGRARPQRYAA